MSRTIEYVTISTPSRDAQAEMNKFNESVGKEAFKQGMNCLLIGFTGMQDGIVLASPTTGLVAEFVYCEKTFLVD